MRDAVFDLDGTIIDSAIQCAEIGRAMLADRSDIADLSLDLVKRLSSLGGRTLVAGMLGEWARCPDADLAEFRLRYATTPTPESSLFPGVVAALSELRDAGIRLSICSAKPQALCEKVLEDVGIAHFFAAIVGSDSTRACKPDPAHWTHLARYLSGSRASCYVGDSEVDAAFADALDMPLIMVTHGYARPGFDFSRHCVAEDFAEVPGLVMEQLASRRARARHVLPAPEMVIHYPA